MKERERQREGKEDICRGKGREIGGERKRDRGKRNRVLSVQRVVFHKHFGFFSFLFNHCNKVVIL